MAKKDLTAAQVIEALGGFTEVARLTSRSYSAPFNWRADSRFPPTLFLLMSRALLDKGIIAPAKLWSMEEAAEREVA